MTPVSSKSSSVAACLQRVAWPLAPKIASIYAQKRFCSTHTPSWNRYAERVMHSLDYGPLVKKPDLLFHGLFFAFWKIPSILEKGILSRRAAEKLNMQLPFNHGQQTEVGITNGHNGSSFICCALAPTHPEGSENYIEEGLSFAINGATPESFDPIDGEVLIDWKIPPTKIAALVIPEHLIETPISEINFLEGGADEVFHLRCQFLAKYLQREYGIKDTELAAKIARPIPSDERINIEQAYNDLLKSCLARKFDLNEPRGFLKLVRSLAPDNLRLFNSKGFPI